MSLVAVREVQDDESATVARIFAHTAVFSDQEREAAVEEFARSRDRATALFAILDGQEVGFLSYQQAFITHDSYDLLWLAVDTAATRRGAARALLRTMCARISVERPDGAILQVETGRGHQAAIRLYLAEGFVLGGSIPDWYGKGWPKLLFWRRVEGLREASRV